MEKSEQTFGQPNILYVGKGTIHLYKEEETGPVGKIMAIAGKTGHMIWDTELSLSIDQHNYNIVK